MAAHPVTLAVVAKVRDYHPVALRQQRHDAVEGHGSVEIPAMHEHKRRGVGLTRLANKHFVLTDEEGPAGQRQRVAL